MASKHLIQRVLPLLLASCAGFGGCATTQSSVPTNSNGWLDPSPSLKRRIDDEGKHIAYTHGVERIDLIRWFAAVGEPAYPKLLELAADPRKDVAIAAYAAMGATRDSRLIPYLEAIEIPDGPDAIDLRLERGRTLLRLGDWNAVPTLISGLKDERTFTRALCAQALGEATHEDFGFDPKAEPAASAEAVARWEAWWKSRSTDQLLAKPKPQPKVTSGD